MKTIQVNRIISYVSSSSFENNKESSVCWVFGMIMQNFPLDEYLQTKFILTDHL